MTPYSGYLDDKIDTARVQMNLAAHTIASRGMPSPKEVEVIGDDLQADADVVRGNRGEDAVVTWEDSELIFRRTLARCLAILDKAEAERHA